MVLADFNLVDALWAMFIFFIWVMFFMILIQCVMDLFRDDSESGAMKALWVICFILFLPFAVLIYLIVRGKGMAERNIERQQQQQAEFNDYVKQAAGTGDPATQIANAKALLDAGTISQAEFDAMKSKALA